MPRRNPNLPDITKLLEAEKVIDDLNKELVIAKKNLEEREKETIGLYRALQISQDICDHPIQEHVYGTGDNYCACCGKYT